MSASHAEASAFRRQAIAAGEAVTRTMAAGRGGLMSVEAAAALRAAVEEFEQLRIKGERLAADLGCPEFAAWIEDLREVGAGPLRMVASMRPVMAN